MNKTVEDCYKIIHKNTNGNNKDLDNLLKNVELGYDWAKIELASLYISLNPNKDMLDEIIDLIDSIEDKDKFPSELNLICGALCVFDCRNYRYPFSDAIIYLNKAIEFDCIDAYYYLYGVYVLNGDIDKVKETLIEGAEKGNENCIFFLANEYMNGNIFKKDTSKAFKQYNRLLGTKSEGMGAYGLYRFYRYGIYVNKDISKSENYKKIAFDKIFHCESVYFDYEIKYLYDNLFDTAEEKISEAMYDLALISLGKEYIGSDDKKNIKLAKYLLESCIDNGYYLACGLLSDIYNDEDNGSVARSLKILELGIKHGDEDSAIEYIELTDYLEIAKLNLENVKLAHKILANNETVQGMYYYTRCLDYGYYRKKNYSKAKLLYEKLISSEYYDACFNLGLMYQEGRGVDKDINKAFQLYKMGIDNSSFICEREIDILKYELCNIIDFTGI